MMVTRLLAYLDSDSRALPLNTTTRNKYWRHLLAAVRLAVNVGVDAHTHRRRRRRYVKNITLRYINVSATVSASILFKTCNPRHRRIGIDSLDIYKVFYI